MIATASSQRKLLPTNYLENFAVIAFRSIAPLKTAMLANPNLDEIQLTKEEYERYSRHIILPEVEGQNA